MTGKQKVMAIFWICTGVTFGAWQHSWWAGYFMFLLVGIIEFTIDEYFSN